MLFTIYTSEGKVIEPLKLCFAIWDLCVGKKIRRQTVILSLHLSTRKKTSSGTLETCLALMNIKKPCQSIAGNAPELPSFGFHPECFLEPIRRS